MIKANEKIRLLKKLLEKSSDVTVESSDDSNFKSWKNLVERTFIKVFGKDSTEFSHFSELNFFYPAMVFFGDSDYSKDHLRCFKEDFSMLKSSIDQYIEEIEEQPENISEKPELENNKQISKVFISHASKDSEIVEEMIEILESIGLNSNQIFCTSFEGYGIGLGNNFLDSIKSELSSDSLVIFILSKSFYNSPVCLCEMGATWVLAKEHIPVLIPPLDYSQVKGVIPLTQGFKINEPLKLNLFKEKIESAFTIDRKLNMSTWERKRDRILTRIEKKIGKTQS
ncbi:MAG: toll/interleukin-1 receptor domain-containing protein [Bacteroidales bacterium]|nr:toll/interleukin-1 receptor domain-containing protein [Bacteroidales bacterium]